MKTCIGSIGYERRSADDIAALLIENGFTQVIDVRLLPLSRKKGLSKTALASAMGAAGIDYVHLKSAGNPHRHLRSDRSRCLRAYSAYLSDHPEVVLTAASMATSRPSAFLCYERHHNDCHRSVLTAAIEDTGTPIEVLRL